jgi:hypothetical protein
VLVHRGDVDDPAAVALLDHPPGCPLRAQERPVEVRRHHRAPLLVVEVERLGGVAGAAVVHQHAHPAELVGELVHDVRRVR